ncbi:MAG: ribonuclease H family protein [Fusobacterium sp.]|nr:ribonuclease H family protein [Fusobacterium sp.]
MAKKFYAYFFNNKENGIVETWDDCKKIVQKSNARYKSFPSFSEAKIWIDTGANYEKKNRSTFEEKELEEAVYFDAGTGRGRGVEVRITDKLGKSLISVIQDDNFEFFLKKNFWFINEFENIELGKEKTNNFGELLGLYLAMECAKKMSLTKIYGDSKLVITYWSKGQFHADKLPENTVNLIKKVIENRKKIEASGISVRHISGDKNPADLGFHK